MDTPRASSAIPTTHDAFQDLCNEIDSLVQHGVGTDPSYLASAITRMIQSEIAKEAAGEN